MTKKDKTQKPDPGSPFAKLQAVKEKLVADEAAEKAKRAAAKAGVASGASSSSSAMRDSLAARTTRGGSSQASARIDKVSAADEAIAFHRLVSGVTPLDTPSKRIPKSQQPTDVAAAAEQAKRRAAVNETAEREAQAVHDHLRALVEGGARFEVSDDGHRVEGRRVEIPADVVRKLRRGMMPIDARLDLHGLRAGEARDQVEAFLRDKRSRGERCVLLVHGKGDHSPAGQGILRGEIAAWLSQTRAADHVAAFATAVDGDGGEGAVYVLLRK